VSNLTYTIRVLSLPTAFAQLNPGFLLYPLHSPPNPPSPPSSPTLSPTFKPLNPKLFKALEKSLATLVSYDVNKMGIHRFILSLVLLLGLGHVAFAYPAFNPGYEVEACELDERQGATASPFLNQEALCDKNCYKTRNACVAKWGPSDGNW
jgi:hypothetical protein